MNKKLLAVAVFAAITTPLAAQAETTLYGYFNVSADAMRGWARGSGTNAEDNPIGTKQNWSQIATNSSYFGIKGNHHLGGDLEALYQLESFVSLSNTGSAPETSNASGSNLSLGSRNSFVGLGSHTWGAIKIGRNDTPYKTSTGSLDPFANTVGDYNAIMGNTAGDNRAEFDFRAAHAIWYESPKWGGFQANLMWGPSQKTNGSPSNVANGEGILCTGGNNGGVISGTGGFAPDPAHPCTDGGFNDVFSASLNYNAGPLFVTAAAERHKAVDRSGDFVNPAFVTTDNPTGAAPFGASVENETAYKIGASYTFGGPAGWGQNKLSGIFEKLQRSGPADDRNRNGYYLSDVQSFGKNDLMLAWARAAKSDLTRGGGVGGGCYANGTCSASANSDNPSLNDSANLYAIGLRHNFTKDVNVYAVYAQDNNARQGHYGLGESGHGLPDTPNGTAGEKFRAFSVGMVTTF